MSDEADPVTRRELVAFRDDVRELSSAIERLRQEMGQTYTRSDVLEPRLKAIEREQARHAEWLLWAQRIVVGAVLVALVGLVVYNGGVPR